MKNYTIHLSNENGVILSTYKVAVSETEEEYDQAIQMYEDGEVEFLFRKGRDANLEGVNEALGHDLKVFLSREQ